MPCSGPSTATSLPTRLSPRCCHHQRFPKVLPTTPAPPGRSALPVPSPAASSLGCCVQQTGRASCRQQSVSGDRIGLDVSPGCCSAVACGSPKGRAPLASQSRASQRRAEGRSCTPRPRRAAGAAVPARWPRRDGEMFMCQKWGLRPAKAGPNPVIYFYLFVLAEVVLEEPGSNSLFSRLRLDQARSDGSEGKCSVCGEEAALQPGLSFSSRFLQFPASSPGQSRASPPFPCLEPQGQGQPLLPRQGLDGARRILRAPCAGGPAASCVVPGCEARGTGRAAGGRDGSRALPGRRGEESGGEDRPRSVHPVPRVCVPGACRGTPAEGVPAPKLCQGRGFPRALPAVVGPDSSHAPGDIPGGKPGWLHCSRVMGSRVGRGLCEPVPQHGWPGQHAGWKRWVAARRACPQQAPTCAQLVLALTHAPMGARVPAVSRQCGPAGVRWLAG